MRWLAALLCAVSLGAAAQTYPSKPVRLIVPYPPAGATDIVARIISQRLGEKWGQAVVVDNKPGAAGNIGTEMAAKSPADGYTLVIGATSNIGTNVTLYEKLPFDPVKDFTPIGLVATSPQVLVVPAALPVNTLPEFVALLKSKPGALNYSTYGNGSLSHLTTELFNTAAGVKVVHVPYKGGGPAITAVMAGEVQMTFATISVALGQIKAGKVRALAVTSKKRFAGLPDVPTFIESGFPTLDADAWVALLAPAGTPQSIVRKINEDANAMVAAPELRKYFAEQGLEPAGGTPEQLAEFIKSEIARWGKAVKISGAKPEQ